jgi:hypothetical protein
MFASSLVLHSAMIDFEKAFDPYFLIEAVINFPEPRYFISSRGGFGDDLTPK